MRAFVRRLTVNLPPVYADKDGMEPWRNPNPFPMNKREGESERRRHGRLRCEELTCNVGQIRDLSASGMQVFRKGGAIAKLGDEMQIVIEYLDSSMAVDVKTVRADKLGFRKHLFGFEFIHLTDEQKSRLGALARVAADRRTLSNQ